MICQIDTYNCFNSTLVRGLTSILLYTKDMYPKKAFVLQQNGQMVYWYKVMEGGGGGDDDSGGTWCWDANKRELLVIILLLLLLLDLW